MIQYIYTNNLLYIPSLKVRLYKSDSLFDEVFQICRNQDSTIDDLAHLLPVLNFKSELLSFEYVDDLETIEIFFNGDYYLLPKQVSERYKSYFHRGSKFKPEYFANFLYKVLSNFEFPKLSLLERLEEYFYSFTNDGSIYVYKEYKSSDKANIDTNSIAILKRYNDVDYATIIKIDPSNLSYNFDIYGYSIGSCVGIQTKPLINEYIYEDRLNFLIHLFTESGYSYIKERIDLSVLDEDLIKKLKEADNKFLDSPKLFQILNILCRCDLNSLLFH